MKVFKSTDPWSVVVILLTIGLFGMSLAVKGITQELFLESGVFLVSVKLILMAGKNAATEQRLELHLMQIKQLLSSNIAQIARDKTSATETVRQSMEERKS